jgi:hypothetical protein
VHSHDFNRHLTPFRAEWDPKVPFGLIFGNLNFVASSLTLHHSNSVCSSMIFFPICLSTVSRKKYKLSLFLSIGFFAEKFSMKEKAG